MPKPGIPTSLNICIVAESFPLLGRVSSYGFLWPIAKKLVEQKHSVTILSWKNPEGKRFVSQEGVDAYFLGIENKDATLNQFPLLIKEKFSQLHSARPFHLVHSIDKNGVLLGLFRKKLKIAMLYDIQATDLASIQSILAMAQENPLEQFKAVLIAGYKFLTTFLGKDRKILKTADGVFVSSPLQQIILERNYLYPELRSFVVPYGMEIGDLSPKIRSEEFRKSLQLPVHAQTVVTYTDMKEMGEVVSLLKAFEKVAIKKSNARLIILGDGPLFKSIEFEVLNLALGGRVILTGKISSELLASYINIADVYVDLSSRNSGFEPSMIEAMAQEKVIIGSEVSPISTIVEEGVSGFLVRPADSQSLSQLILKTFSKEIPSQQMGLKAREKVLSIFDTQKMVSQTLLAYKKTLALSGFYKHSFSWLDWK